MGELITYFIVITATVFAIYRLFFSRRSKGSIGTKGCDTCDTAACEGCPLMEIKKKG